MHVSQIAAILRIILGDEFANQMFANSLQFGKRLGNTFNQGNNYIL